MRKGIKLSEQLCNVSISLLFVFGILDLARACKVYNQSIHHINSPYPLYAASYWTTILSIVGPEASHTTEHLPSPSSHQQDTKRQEEPCKPGSINTP